MANRVSIFGVPIDALTTDEVLDRLQNAISAKLATQIVTVNPEFLVRTRYDKEFRRVLKNAQLAVADGMGIRAAATYTSFDLPTWQPARLLMSFLQGFIIKFLLLSKNRLLQQPIPETVTGVDLVWKIANLAEQHGWRMYLLGGNPSVAQQAAERLRATYTNLVILGAEEGIPKGRYDDAELRKHVAKRIGQTRPDIVFVAFGAPRQDFFIAEHAKELRASIMMGVGGSLDFIAGIVTRAPQWMRSLGIEWLWRLIQQPWRWRRIVTAVITFPWLVFIDRQTTRRYRPNT